MTWKKLGQALKPEQELEFTYLGYKRYTIVILFMSTANAMNFPRHFLCVSLWDLPCVKKIKNIGPFSFINCYPALITWLQRLPCLTLAPSALHYPAAIWTTIPDRLDGIYSAIKDNALLSKFAGGLGNDWTPVRAMGAHIQGTNGKSQGVVPFLNVANATAVAVNQGGKRKGAVCAYLECWHRDVEEFLELRKNTGTIDVERMT